MKSNQKTSVFSIIIVAAMFLSIISAFGSVTVSSAGNPNDPANDGYKYPLVAGDVDSASYYEWWYFELRDNEHGLDMFFFYEIDNPDNVEGGVVSQSWVGCGVMVDDVVIDTSTQPTDYGSFQASTTNLDINIGGDNTVKALNPNTIEIVGNDRLANVSWDLVYKRESIQASPIVDVPVSTIPGDTMGYIIFMARASVNGIVTVNGVDYEINDAVGYHDHNWGDPLGFVYDPWARIDSGDMFASIGGFPRLVFQNLPNPAFALMWKDGEWKYLQKGTVEYLETGIDANTGVEYTTKYHFVIKDKAILPNTVLEFHGEEKGGLAWSSIESYTGINLLLRKSYTFEYSGTLKERGLVLLRTTHEFSVMGSNEQSQLVSLS